MAQIGDYRPQDLIDQPNPLGRQCGLQAPTNDEGAVLGSLGCI